MKIDILTIENFKSIENLRIEFNGGNAVISGQNGTGKTTVIDAVCWLFTNKMSDGRTGESANLHDTDKITNVEVIFDNGLKFRRECNGKSSFFINDVLCGMSNFKDSVSEIFKGAIPTLLTPFNFCNLHYSDRRNILLKLFAAHIEIDTSEFDSIADYLKKSTPNQIIKTVKLNKRKLEEQLIGIPARIDELHKNIVAVDLPALRAEIETTQRNLDDRLAVVKQCQKGSDANLEPYNEYIKADSEARKLEDNLSNLRAEYRNNEIEFNRLRKEYETLQKATEGTCPLCGNSVPAQNLDKIYAELENIVAQGKKLSEKQELIQKGAAVAKDKIAQLRAQAETSKKLFEELKKKSNSAEDLQAALAKCDELQTYLAQLQAKVAEGERADTIQKRIEKLKQQELTISAEISKCEKQIYQAEMYVRRQIELTEKAINDQFQFVSFKMFEGYKSSEGVKECCEPMLNEIPYAALSKGEQLKVSLDILQALQKAYGVELPVFIDDSESYTSNSFLKLPNQIIFIKAVEGVKTLDISLAETVERKSA